MVCNEVTLMGLDQVDGINKKNKLPVRCTAAFYRTIGYADEARNMMLNLDRECFEIKVIPIDKHHDIPGLLEPETRTKLDRLIQGPDHSNSVNIIWLPGYCFIRNPDAITNIGRTMFETDRIPPDWVTNCNSMDEIWVPSQFNVETFAQAGVKRKKLFVIPGGIDTSIYSVDITPMDWPDKKGFNFLSVFEWMYRKGWDVLLKAYLIEFSKKDDVSLILKINTPSFTTFEKVQRQIAQYINYLGLNLENIPAVVLINKNFTSKEMAALYKACDAFVLPSRGEGWGRPYMEAMAIGLPTIGTRWSGQLEFMHDENSYLIDIDGLEAVSSNVEMPFYRGHRWARPSLEHTMALMRQVYENREHAYEVGRKARKEVLEKWSWAKAAEKAGRRLEQYCVWK